MSIHTLPDQFVPPDVAANNPFLRRGGGGAGAEADVKTLHVAFLEDHPDLRRAADLDPARSPGDELHLNGREVYLRLAAGMGKTKLTNAYLDSKLRTVSTFRNLATIRKLAAMCDG